MRDRRIGVTEWSLWSGLAIALLAVAIWGTIPLAVQFHCGRARLFLQTRDHERALRELRRALRLTPDGAEIHLLLARVHRRLGHLDSVLPLLRRAQKLGGDRERAEREMWLTWAQSGKLREAEPHLPELLKDSRDDGADICEAYVQGYFANLRVQEALELLDAWQRDFPDDARSYFMRGYLLQALARYPEATLAYRRGLQLAPGETTMRFRLAEVLTELQELDEAGRLFRRCVQESPDNPEIVTAWANCLSVQGQADEARRLLQRTLATHRRHFEALRKLGEIELAQGRFEQARQHLEAAAHERPYDTTTHNALAKTLRALGRADEAQPHFDYVAQAEESLARMERELRQVVDRPRDAELRYDIGLTLLKYGSPEDGVKWLRTVLELQPDHAAAHQALAAYYESRGDWQNAARHRGRGRKP